MAETVQETAFEYDTFFAELDTMSAEDVLFALMAHSSEVVQAWGAMFDARSDGAREMGLLFTGMMRRVERAHGKTEPVETFMGIPSRAERLVPDIDMNWGAVAEHYLFTIESERGRPTVDWAMEFMAQALAFHSPGDALLHIGRARNFFAPVAQITEASIGDTSDQVIFT